MIPTAIERKGTSIEIAWSDGAKRMLSPGNLRKACPCAICRERKSGQESSKSSKVLLPVLSKEETLPLEIRTMEPVGNYAYNVHFSDGHNSGIFTFDLLYSLGEPSSNEIRSVGDQSGATTQCQ